MISGCTIYIEYVDPAKAYQIMIDIPIWTNLDLYNMPWRPGQRGPLVDEALQ
jgi:hypothetical protein